MIDDIGSAEEREVVVECVEGARKTYTCCVVAWVEPRREIAVGDGGWEFVFVLEKLPRLKNEPAADQDALLRDIGRFRCCACSVADAITHPHRAQLTVSLLGLMPATVVGLE